MADIDSVDDYRAVQSLFHAGVPMKYRASVYRYCCGHLQDLGEGLFRRLESQQASVAEETMVQIRKDLGRTFGASQRPQNFEARLQRVLCAYALHDPTVGYCQGLNYIAGFFLFFFQDEIVFELLACLGTHIFKGYFVPSMQGIRGDMAVCLKLMMTLQPDCHAHIAEIIPPELIVQSTLQTLFVNSGCSVKNGAMLPPDTLLRLFDCIFLSCLHPDYSRHHTVLLCTYMVPNPNPDRDWKAARCLALHIHGCLWRGLPTAHRVRAGRGRRGDGDSPRQRCPPHTTPGLL